MLDLLSVNHYETHLLSKALIIDTSFKVFYKVIKDIEIGQEMLLYSTDPVYSEKQTEGYHNFENGKILLH